jgi:hypothetical protein
MVIIMVKNCLYGVADVYIKVRSSYIVGVSSLAIGESSG